MGGWLFSGDLFLSPYVKVLRIDENPHQVIASLRKVLALPISTVYDSGGKVVEDGRGVHLLRSAAGCSDAKARSAS